MRPLKFNIWRYDRKYECAVRIRTQWYALIAEPTYWVNAHGIAWTGWRISMRWFGLKALTFRWSRRANSEILLVDYSRSNRETND